MVRYPADGMAYITLARLHPDQTDPVLVSGPTALVADIVTLVAEDGVWKVHAVGEMVPPGALGITAYSW
jgi:hypothetical protein